MDKICRSCMSESPQMRNIFEIKEAQEGNSFQLAEMFMACTSIPIKSDDGLPIQLCQMCESKLDAAFEFKQQCVRTNTTLWQISNAATSSKTSIKSESLDVAVQPDVNNLSMTPANGGDSKSLIVNHSEEKYTKINNTAAKYICSYCKKVLRTKKGLMFHQRRHTGEQLRACHLCPAKFTRSNHLTRHLRLHNKSYNSINKEKPEKLNEDESKSVMYRDEYDETDTEIGLDDLKDEDFIVKRKRRFKKPRINDDSKNKENEKEKHVMQCEFCDRKFKYKKSFFHHMQMEHGMTDEGDLALGIGIFKIENSKEDTIECLPGENACDPQDISINSHSTDDESYGLEDESSSKVVAKRTLYPCHVCNVEFTRANHLTRHMTIHRALLTHKCEKCDKAFLTQEYLDKHIQEDHINKPYVCNVCQKPFNRGEQFIRHLRTHDSSSTEENHKCSICDKIFTRSDHLARHTKAHLQQDKRHVCGDCGKAFNRLDNLKTHQRIHSGLKDNSRLHLCIYCGKDFNSSSNMIVHMRRHTGERPYKCSICNKGFPRSHDLKCHERTHSGEKPYLCTLCGKSFNKSNKLLRHTRVHTGERPYVCSICGRAFTQSNDLALHMRRHTGARPYVCGVCPARFIQSGQLKAHRRSTNHWMDIPPDLKGGHRVEQVTPIINPAPIKFKTHGKDLKLKDEDIYGDVVKDEPHNIIQQVNIMGMDNNLAVIPPPYILDSKLLQPPTATGYLVFASVLNQSAEVILDTEKYKTSIQNCSSSSVHSDDTGINKVDNASSIAFSPASSNHTYSSGTPADQYSYENYG